MYDRNTIDLHNIFTIVQLSLALVIIRRKRNIENSRFQRFDSSINKALWISTSPTFCNLKIIPSHSNDFISNPIDFQFSLQSEKYCYFVTTCQFVKELYFNIKHRPKKEHMEALKLFKVLFSSYISEINVFSSNFFFPLSHFRECINLAFLSIFSSKHKLEYIELMHTIIKGLFDILNVCSLAERIVILDIMNELAENNYEFAIFSLEHCVLTLNGLISPSNSDCVLMKTYRLFQYSDILTYIKRLSILCKNNPKGSEFYEFKLKNHPNGCLLPSRLPLLQFNMISLFYELKQ